MAGLLGLRSWLYLVVTAMALLVAFMQQRQQALAAEAAAHLPGHTTALRALVDEMSQLQQIQQARYSPNTNNNLRPLRNASGKAPLPRRPAAPAVHQSVAGTTRSLVLTLLSSGRDGQVRLAEADAVSLPSHRVCGPPRDQNVYQYRLTWKQPDEPTVAYFHRLRNQTDLRLYIAGQVLPPVTRVPAITHSRARPTPQIAPWRRWWSYPSTTPPEAPNYVVVLRDVWVRNSWVLECRRAFTAGACFKESYRTPAVPSNAEVREVDRVFVLGDPWAYGYFHWTQEHLPRLAILYDFLMANPDVKVMIDMTTKIPTSWMDLLGFNRTRLVDCRLTYRARVAFYATPMTCGHSLLQPLLALRAVTAKRLGLVEDREDRHTASFATNASRRHPRPLRILVPLRQNRQPRNMDGLGPALRRAFPSAEVEVRTFQGVGLRDQVIAFHRADVVIGAHGANLANAMFMRLNATVVEFVPQLTANPCYYGLAARLGLRYRMVVLAGVQQGSEHGVDVPFGEVLEHVTEIYKEHSS